MTLTSKLSIWLKSIQQGFILTLPVVILGSIALSLLQVPQFLSIDSSQYYIFQLASWLHKASYSIMALTLTLGISYKLSIIYKQKYRLLYSPIINTIISFICFMGITYIDHNTQALEFLGVQSIAKAIITAIFTTEFIVLFYNHKLQKLYLLQYENNNDIHKAIHACLPAILVTFSTLLLYDLLLSNNHFLGNIIPFIIGEIDRQIGLNLIQSYGLIIFNQAVWFFGIHPSSLIEINPALIYSPIDEAIYARHFFDTYAHIGGAGSTLGLIGCLIFSQNKLHKKLGLYAILPGIFNINEILIFGIPIVFNRYLLLPFILAPLATTTLARILIETGFLSLDPNLSSWNTPVIFSGYLSGGLTASVAQFFMIILSAAIYWPFLKRYEAKILIEKNRNVKSMIKDLCNPDLNFKNLLKRQTPLADFCRQLQTDMKEQFGKQNFSMHYQPKINNNYKITATEALIRWQHPTLGNIPPCIFINIAETDDFIHKLGHWINNRCMEDINKMKARGIKGIQVAINVSPIQLTRDEFFKVFSATIQQHNIPFNELELEITESQHLQLNDQIISGLLELSSKGISIAVDDFGMGYTSLKYLKSFKVDTIKLDGSIVKDVLKSEIVKDIIRSLSSLTLSMKGKLVAEWVEDEEQYKQLIELGCNQFQGAYFSMPISRDDFITLYLGQENENKDKNRST